LGAVHVRALPVPRSDGEGSVAGTEYRETRKKLPPAIRVRRRCGEVNPPLRPALSAAMNIRVPWCGGVFHARPGPFGARGPPPPGGPPYGRVAAFPANWAAVAAPPKRFRAPFRAGFPSRVAGVTRRQERPRAGDRCGNASMAAASLSSSPVPSLDVGGPLGQGPVQTPLRPSSLPPLCPSRRTTAARVAPVGSASKQSTNHAGAPARRPNCIGGPCGD